MDQLKQQLLTAPDSQLDAKVKPLIEKWSSPPKALEILEVLDMCVHGSSASGFVVNLLEVMLDASINEENTTYEKIVSQATWRELL
jgi:hypothetical protein